MTHLCYCVTARVWASDQRWYCVLKAALRLCSSGFLPIHPFLHSSFSHYRCRQRLEMIRLKPLTHFLTSHSPDLIANGGLRAGGGEQRKPLRRFLKGPEADLGGDGKMFSA